MVSRKCTGQLGGAGLIFQCSNQVGQNQQPACGVKLDWSIATNIISTVKNRHSIRQTAHTYPKMQEALYHAKNFSKLDQVSKNRNTAAAAALPISDWTQHLLPVAK
jgi:hypothetical protein